MEGGDTMTSNKTHDDSYQTGKEKSCPVFEENRPYDQPKLQVDRRAITLAWRLASLAHGCGYYGPGWPSR
jgi:hypothetical protein